METEYIKDQAAFVERLNSFIKDVIYGSILNFHVQLYKETNGHLESIQNFNNLCTFYVSDYLTRYFNGGISKWIKDETQDNHFKALVLPIKEVVSHGYGCFLNFLMMFCSQTLMQVDLTTVKFDAEIMEFDKLEEQIDEILEKDKEFHIGAFNHHCYNKDDIKDWDPEKPIFGMGPPEESEGKTVLGVQKLDK